MILTALKMMIYEITYETLHNEYVLWIKSRSGYAKILRFKTRQEAEKYVKENSNGNNT